MKEIDKIKKNIKNGGLKIKLVCRAIELLMPRYYEYLKTLTTSEFKRVLVTHHLLGQWREFPTIQEMEIYHSSSITYFSTFLTLLEDRGIEQEKYMTWTKPWIPEVLGGKDIPRAFERILREDEKNEKFNIGGLTSLNAEAGSLFLDSGTGKMKVYDGKSWQSL